MVFVHLYMLQRPSVNENLWIHEDKRVILAWPQIIPLQMYIPDHICKDRNKEKSETKEKQIFILFKLKKHPNISGIRVVESI